MRTFFLTFTTLIALQVLAECQSPVGLWLCYPKDATQKTGHYLYYRFNEDGTVNHAETGAITNDPMPPSILWLQKSNNCNMLFRTDKRIFLTFTVTNNKLMKPDGQPMAVRVAPNDLPTEFIQPTHLEIKKGTQITLDGVPKVFNADMYVYSLAPEIANIDTALREDIDHAIAINTFVINYDPADEYAYFYRAYCFGLKGDWEKAIADYDRSIELYPRFASAYRNLANVYERKGDYRNQLKTYNEEKLQVPNNATVDKSLGWLLATCTDSNIRDGQKAVDYAKQACDLTQWKAPDALDTLAAAYAENGDYDQAVKYERQYLNSQGLLEKQTTDANMRLSLYQSQKPYHRDK